MTAVDPSVTVEITVDGAAVQARPGELLIEACERNGVYIPRFCYHPRMNPVGMCRMCLVEVDTGRGFALQPSCMVPVSDQMKVATESEVTKKAQDGVLEFLLINHPLDCPVCDKGGECPLQDQTMAYGPGETRFVEEKRHFSKPIAISDTVFLDRERCILCDRCTRFADEVAGDALIHFAGRGNHTEVATFSTEPFASYFSGNTVQICPVGALTAAPYRFKARPWDLSETLSTAWVDSVGARIAVQASRNQVLRVLGADADAVNWGWLSDKERFGFEALNSSERLTVPQVRDAIGAQGAELRTAGWSEALEAVVSAIAAVEPQRVAVLGGARLTNEAQYMWARLAKGVIGTDNADAQLGDGLDPEVVFGLPGATIDEVCRPGGTVVLVGPDPKEELGTLYLRLRHAIVNDGVTLIEVTPCDTGLTSLAAHCLRPEPGTTAQVVAALVSAATSGDPMATPDGKDTVDTDDAHGATEIEAADGEVSNAGVEAAGTWVDQDALAAAARCLAAADGGVSVVLGRASVAESAEVIADAAMALAELPQARFLHALRRGNVRGALEAGLSPGLLPGRARLDAGDRAGSVAEVWPRLPDTVGMDAEAILESAVRGEIDVLVLVGADPLNDFVDRDLAYRGLRGASLVVAVDLFLNDSASLAAGVVLPAAGPTECDGTFTNFEGRVSVTRRAVTPPGTARPDWMIAAELSERLDPGSAAGLDSVESIRAEVARVSPVHAPLTEEALTQNQLEGVVLAGAGATGTAVGCHEGDHGPRSRHQATPATGSAGQQARPEDGFWLVASRTMYDDGVMLRHCASSRNLAAPALARINPGDLAGTGVAAGETVRVVSEGSGHHIEATLTADGGVPSGVLAVNWLAPGAPANSLIGAGASATVVRIEAR